MSKKAYIFLAPGFEETEAIAPVDILRRGGVEVEIVGVGDIAADSSHGICVSCDTELDFADLSVDEDDVMIFPGGMPGSKNLAECESLMAALNAHYRAGGLVAAICAAPAVVLASKINGLKEGVSMTCYPGFEATLAENGVTHVNSGVVFFDNVITARSAAVAIKFGLTILAAMKGAEVAAKVANDIVFE